MEKTISVSADSSVWVAIIEKLPPWFLMFAIVGLVALICFWVLPHIRRDKQGKLYWHSDRFEQIKQTKKMDSLTETLTHVVKKINRLELEDCRIIVHTEGIPLSERISAGIRYINAGGNGETKKMIENKLRKRNPEMYEGIKKLIEEKESSKN